MSKTHRFQHTIGKEVSYSGIGLHTGQDVQMRFCPAPAGSGISFKRVDLPGAPLIPAAVEYVVDTNRSTTLGIGDVKVHTVEHVLSALHAFGVDNLVIELDAMEPPVANGSAEQFVAMLDEAGILEQTDEASLITLKAPVYFSHEDVHLVALPYPSFRISYTLHYPDSQVLNAQYQSFELSSSIYREEIAPCRTFSLYGEVAALIDRGLIKGGSLSNAVVIKDDVVLSKEGLRFSDEMVRHKILDLIGDLSLIGFSLQAHIIAIRSGHFANVAFAKELLTHISQESK